MQPRIWNKITGEIAMIDVIDWNDKYVVVSQDYIWNEDPETGEGECQVYFKDIELMWPTGFLDKNGIEIFEGDILKGIDGWEDKKYENSTNYLSEIYSVVWEDAGLVLMNQTGEYVHFKSYWWEVIGNKWENPELLKEVEV